MSQPDFVRFRLYLSGVNPARKCSRPLCPNLAVATLTYVYADCTMVVGPLATYAEPHCYDLCQAHSSRMVAPRGWELVRLETDPASLQPSAEDLAALAEAVRRAGDLEPSPADKPVGRRGHLHVVPNN